MPASERDIVMLTCVSGCDCHGRRADGFEIPCARFRFHSPHAVRVVRNQPGSKQALARVDKAMASMGTRAAYRTASSQRVQDFIVTQTAAKMNSCTHWRDQNHHHEPLEAELTGSPSKAREWPKTKIKWPDDQGEKKRREIAAAPVSHLALLG